MVVSARRKSLRPQGDPGAVCRPLWAALRLCTVAPLAEFDEGRGRRNLRRRLRTVSLAFAMRERRALAGRPAESRHRRTSVDGRGPPIRGDLQLILSSRLALLCDRESTTRSLPSCQRQPRRGGIKPPGRWMCGPTQEIGSSSGFRLKTFFGTSPLISFYLRARSPQSPAPLLGLLP